MYVAKQSSDICYWRYSFYPQFTNVLGVLNGSISVGIVWNKRVLTLYLWQRARVICAEVTTDRSH